MILKNHVNLVLKTLMLPLQMKLKSKNMTLKMTGKPYKGYEKVITYHLLYLIYISMTSLELGVSLGNTQICILLDADDTALISEYEQNLLKMLDHVGYWCNK